MRACARLRVRVYALRARAGARALPRLRPPSAQRERRAQARARHSRRMVLVRTLERIMTVYAKGTSVSVAKSRAEIESMLSRYGASSFASGWDGPTAVIMFEAKGRRIRFSLPLPDPKDRAFTRDPRHTWKERSKAAAQQAYEAECRQRWRALALVIKAKLEAVESGIALFEDEFLANIVIPGGQTFGEWARPELARAYETGVGMPPLLGAAQ